MKLSRAAGRRLLPRRRPGRVLVRVGPRGGQPTDRARRRASSSRWPSRPRRRTRDDEDRADPARGIRDRLVRGRARAGSATCRPDRLGRGGRDPARSRGPAAACRPRRRALPVRRRAPTRRKTYAFNVRQTYSDGTVVDWTGAGVLRHAGPGRSRRSRSLGGGGSSTLAIDRARRSPALALVVARRRALRRAGRRSAGVTAARAGASSSRRGRGGARAARGRVGARRARAHGRRGERGVNARRHEVVADVQRAGRAALRDRLGHRRGRTPGRRPARRGARPATRTRSSSRSSTSPRAGTSSTGA